MRGSTAGLAAWQRNSFIDFPGTVSTVLFYSGCNLRCPYCHNPAIALGQLHEAPPEAEIRSFLEKRAGDIGGVVFSGGEPSLHDSIPALAADIRKLGYRIKLDTNGLRPEFIARLAPDYLAVDLKTDPASYRTLLQSPYEDTQERLVRSLDAVRSMGAQAEVRVTAAPGIVDETAVERMAGMVAGVARVILQPLRTRTALLSPEFNGVRPFTADRMARLRDILATSCVECVIRGA